MARIIVTGGAGYIGSHTILDLINNGHEVLSIDNYSNSTEANFQGIEELTGRKLQNYNIDLAEDMSAEETFRDIGTADVVIHLAAYKYVGESVTHPFKYYNNNVKSMLNVLSGMKSQCIRHLVHSSSCTVYGNPERLPVNESTPMGVAESPYGVTKQINEIIIADAVRHGTGINAINLRYFNPAGIDKSGKLTETTKSRQETLVPIIKEVFDGEREDLVVFGTDFDTRDGSPVRDYLHITDLASAHTKAVENLLKTTEIKSNQIFNLGLGQGVTVIEMIDAAEKVYGRKLNYKFGPRRDGDVAAIFADIATAKSILGWYPKLGIKDIFSSLIN